MIRVLAFHQGRSYLPELQAYRRHFNGREEFQFDDVMGAHDDPACYHAHWFFPGVYRRRWPVPTVHEYTSLSTGSWRGGKDLVKRLFNARPDHRIFLNPDVQNGFGFRDGVTASLRDMGVPAEFFRPAPEGPREFDFFYAGSIVPERGLVTFLEALKNGDVEGSILLAGEPAAEIATRFRGEARIQFAGRVPQEEIPRLAARAKYAVNLVPDSAPFNLQASTKLLEYCAMQLKVVSTSYHWVNSFAQRRNARFFTFSEYAPRLRADELSGFDFHTPSVEDLEWGQVIERANLAGILRGLAQGV
jgi:glycosyltransferase involved in cell wall biosynthesis